MAACRGTPRPPAPSDDPTEAAEVVRLARAGQAAEADRRAAALLARAADPVAASTAIRQLAAGGCARLATALAALDARATVGARAFSAATFIGLVDDARDAAACPGEPSSGPARPASAAAVGAATAIARARARADRPEAALEALAAAPPVAAVRVTRATLLGQLGRRPEAVSELRAALAAGDDPRVRGQLARLLIALGTPAEALAVLDGAAVARADGGRADGTEARLGGETLADAELVAGRVAALAAAGRVDETLAAVRAAPVDQRPALAREVARAVADPDALVSTLSAGSGDAGELLDALAERIEAERGRRAALPALKRAAAAAPNDARAQEALGEALADDGQLDAAVAAWDRAAALAPQAERPRLRPIVLYAQHGRRVDALARARRLAVAARRPVAGGKSDPDARAGQGNADALAFASAAASAAGDRAAALALAEEAARARPADGRLAFQVARRLDEAGRSDDALTAYATLLVCGAHGKGWHRHEIASRLLELARRAGRARAAAERLRAPLGCPRADPAELDPTLRDLLVELAR
ncbi:MAG TPA: hypothetical protein VMZ28_21200 [Kofleriaceae bacterium]|nr:hypothetical protein [Kofleriaceae bacterium]